jgi:hypothetical protein
VSVPVCDPEGRRSEWARSVMPEKTCTVLRFIKEFDFCDVVMTMTSFVSLPYLDLADRDLLSCLNKALKLNTRSLEVRLAEVFNKE